MFSRSLILLAAASCVSGPADYRTIDDGVESLPEMMARLAAAPCPVPPEFPPSDGFLWNECYGKVVAVAGGVVAVEMDDPSDLPSDVHHLVVSVIRSGDDDDSFGGAGVVVGRAGTTLVCRFFGDRLGMIGRAVVGDLASADFGRTRVLDGIEAFRARWSKMQRN